MFLEEGAIPALLTMTCLVANQLQLIFIQTSMLFSLWSLTSTLAVSLQGALRLVQHVELDEEAAQ